MISYQKQMKLERGNSPQEVSEMTGTQTGQRNSSGTFENFLLKLTLTQWKTKLSQEVCGILKSNIAYISNAVVFPFSLGSEI